LIGFIGMRPRPRGFPGTPVVPICKAFKNGLHKEFFRSL